MTPEEQLAVLTAGTAKVLSEKELLEKLRLGRPLRIKLGVDPTAPDIHFGHTVALEKLRQFQLLGHQAVLLIGDFTATIGDPSGRSATRPPLTRDEVLANAATYTDQAFKILDKEKTEIVYNGDWFRKMSYDDILKLNARVSLQQMLQREDFRTRIAQGQDVRLHELQYPIMQGWDSVEIRADVELGGTDQLFNILVGRDLQKEEGQPQQVVIVMPLLEGLDGVKKMSKSYGNYVGVSDAPQEMFGKLMSVSDELMARYYLVLLGEQLDGSIHPMEAKKLLAEKLTTRFHGEEAGKAARDDWDTRFSKKDLAAAELPVIALDETKDEVNPTVLTLTSKAFEKAFGIAKSNSELRKQYIQSGSVQLNGEKLTDPNLPVTLNDGDILKLSKKHVVRFKPAFRVKQDPAGHYRFNLVKPNGMIVLSSEGFLTLESALDAIKKLETTHHELRKSSSGSWYFLSILPSGQILAQSEIFIDREKAESVMNEVVASYSTATINS